MPTRSSGYGTWVTQDDDRDASERDRAARLDPERAVDELEERVLGREAPGDEARSGDQAPSDDQADDRAEEPADNGTGVDAESPG